MRHSLLAVAATGLGALLTTSCTQDEMVLQNQDEIRFSVSAASPSRAAESFCNQSLPKEFTLWAQTSGETHSPYISGASVEMMQGGTYGFTDGDTRFWPREGNLDFIAFHGDEHTFNNDMANPAFVNFRVNDNPARQTDLIYAVKNNVAKTADAVPLNFRHALAQVMFSARVTNENLLVVIDSISIGHLKNQGTFTFSAADETSTTWLDENHLGDPATIDPNAPRGQWSDLIGVASYSVKTSNIAVTPTSGDVCLTFLPSHKDNTTPKNYVREVLNLIPQQQEAWVPIPNANFNGTYIAVKCEIYSTEGGENILLNPDQHWTYIPAAVDWQPGVRYVYTLDFGHGNAGYESPFEGGHETLTPIDLTVSTDDYAGTGYSSYEIFAAKYIVPEGMARWSGLDEWYHFTTAKTDSIPMPYGPTIPNDNFQPFTECDFYGWVSWEFFNDKINGVVDIPGTADRVDRDCAAVYDANGQVHHYMSPRKPGEKVFVDKYGQYTFYACWRYHFYFTADYHLDDMYGKTGQRYNTIIGGKVGARTIIPYELQSDSINVVLGPPAFTGDTKRVPEGYRLLGFSREYKPYIDQNLTEADCDWLCSEPVTLDNSPYDGTNKTKIQAKITLPWGREERGHYTIHAVWGPDPDYNADKD